MFLRYIQGFYCFCLSNDILLIGLPNSFSHYLHSNIYHRDLKLDQRKRMYSHHSDAAGVILDESQSGRTINIQRGFDQDKPNLSQKEDSELHTGDSSNIQKSRHSSSSSASNVATSETRRIQLSSTGDKPDVLVTTYTQNNSGSGSISTGDLSSGNRGVIFHSGSGEHGGTTTLGGGFRGSDETTLDARVPSLEERQESRVNHSESFENRWGGTSDSRGRGSSSDKFDSNLRHQEWLRQEEHRRQEEQRRQEEEVRLERERVKEQQTIRVTEPDDRYYQRRLEEERRRIQEEEEKRHREEQVRRLEEEEIRRRQEIERRRIQEEEHRLEQERRHGGSSGGRFISGDREETVRGGEFGFQLHNVTSTQELERIFGTLSKSSTGYELYRRQGKQYVQFMARFRTAADRREYIEFQDGSMFPLQDRYGGQSYVSESTEPRDGRFLRIEGELSVESNGKGFIVLKDGRRFPLQGSFSYTEERTYTVDPREGHQEGGGYESKSYGSSWNEETSQAGDLEGSYESRYNSTHEERRTENRRVTSRVYGREKRKAYDNKESIRVPHSNVDSRSKRESDMVEMKEFKQFERLHRRPRDLEDDPIMSESDFDDRADYENDPRAQEPVSPCDAAKCVMLRCVLGPLKKDQEVWIGARYAVDARTLKKAAPLEKVKVSTKLVARVTKQPFIGAPAEQVIKSHEIKTNVEPSITPSAPDVIPLWVVVLSACAGTIILLLLIFLLYKVCLLCKLRDRGSGYRESEAVHLMKMLLALVKDVVEDLLLRPIV